ncbi:unnamed protein product [Calicophoron daubneyi]|uniref:Protein CNPPD1 n=1 Tax=Calicophoron daubneyi TaxID=300641 RepID=A0AAV2TW89_CALDB
MDYDRRRSCPSANDVLHQIYGEDACDLQVSPNIAERIAGFVNSATTRRLGKLDAYTVAEYLSSKHVPPVSMLTALIFIEKLTGTDPPPGFLQEVTSVDLFVVSMMIASKYLHDLGTEYGVCNADWAEDFNIDLKELNQLEIRFLSAMNWRLFVSRMEFFSFCSLAGLLSSKGATATVRQKQANHPVHLPKRLKGARLFRKVGRGSRSTAKILAILGAAYLTCLGARESAVDPSSWLTVDSGTFDWQKEPAVQIEDVCPSNLSTEYPSSQGTMHHCFYLRRSLLSRRSGNPPYPLFEHIPLTLNSTTERSEHNWNQPVLCGG